MTRWSYPAPLPPPPPKDVSNRKFIISHAPNEASRDVAMLLAAELSGAIVEESGSADWESVGVWTVDLHCTAKQAVVSHSWGIGQVRSLPAIAKQMMNAICLPDSVDRRPMPTGETKLRGSLGLERTTVDYERRRKRRRSRDA